MTIANNTKSPKFLLLYPPSLLAQGFAKKAVLPLGIAYLAAVLRNEDVYVDVIDCVIEDIGRNFTFNNSEYYGLALEEIKNRIIQGSYDVVGVSCQFSVMLEITVEICRIAKECGVPYVIVGGPHASAQPESLLTSKTVDYVFIGEGEKIIVEFVDCMRKGEIARIKELRGVAYMEDGQVQILQDLSFIEDIDGIPFPARDLFPINKYYTKCVPMGGVYKSRKNLSMITSRGCPAKCSFCASTRFWGKTFREHSTKRVLDEMQELKNKYGAEEVQFQDDNFTLNKKKTLQICSQIIDKELNIPWSVPAGLALWTLDEHVIDAMSASGCHYVAVAIESGNKRVLAEVIRKPMNLDKVPGLCKHFKKRGIKLTAFFIIGFPDERLVEIKDTFNFAAKCKLDNATFFFPVPLPGSPLWSQAKKENLFVDGFSLKNMKFDEVNLKSNNWSIREMLSLVQNEKRIFYLKTLLRNPRTLLFRILEMLRNDPVQLFSMIKAQLFSKRN